MKSFEKVKEESLQKIENLFHVVLPEDYRKFLLDFNGKVVFNTESDEVYLKDIDQFINIDVLYGINTGKSECNIEYWTEKYFDDLLANTIIIGDSLQHGFIVMICAGENSGVYYYDDSYYFEESNDERNVYLIAKNFEEFGKLLKIY